MIIGSIYVTAGAIIFGVPIGILTSVFMAMYCPKKIYRPLKAATELLAGIPSVIWFLRHGDRSSDHSGLWKNFKDDGTG